MIQKKITKNTKEEKTAGGLISKHTHVCACSCVSARARERATVFMCVCVCAVTQHPWTLSASAGTCLSSKDKLPQDECGAVLGFLMVVVGDKASRGPPAPSPSEPASHPTLYPILHLHPPPPISCPFKHPP